MKKLGALTAATALIASDLLMTAALAGPFDPPKFQEINYNSSRSNRSGKNGLTAPAGTGYAVTIKQGIHVKSVQTDVKGMARFNYVANGSYELTVQPGKDTAVYVIGTKQLTCQSTLVNGNTLKCDLTITHNPGTRVDVYVNK